MYLYVSALDFSVLISRPVLLAFFTFAPHRRQTIGEIIRQYPDNNKINIFWRENCIYFNPC